MARRAWVRGRALRPRAAPGQARRGARPRATKALAADPNQSWALYLSGVIALKDTSAAGTKAGIEKLKKAIAVDPELGQAWRTLAKAYTRAKDKPALEQLARTTRRSSASRCRRKRCDCDILRGR